MGLPLPGETILIAAAVYAGTPNNLDIRLFILAANSGTIVGDSIGFWVGNRLGFRLLLRHERHVGRSCPTSWCNCGSVITRGLRRGRIGHAAMMGGLTVGSWLRSATLSRVM